MSYREENGQVVLTRKTIRNEVRRRRVRFWGRDYVIKPRLLDWVHGDGRQVIYFTPLSTRPNYYVVRLDSRLDLSSHQFYDEVLDCIYEAIEDEFGSSYEEWQSGKNGRTYARHNPFPALNDDCGSCWGLL